MFRIDRYLVPAGYRLDARAITEQALKIAAGICIYTNENLSFEELAGA